MSSRLFKRASIAVALVLCWLAASMAPAPSAGAASSQSASSSSSRATRLIVTVADGSNPDAVAADHARRLGVRVTYVYRRAVHGYAAMVTPSVRRALRHDRRVTALEFDHPVHITGVRSGVGWNLDRLDQPQLPLDGRLSTHGSGAGVTAYIVDTGIRLTHTEFGGRAESGFDAVDGGSADDCNGHGTHVAGTVGGRSVGAAPGVRLVAVRVLDCNGQGSTASVIAGIDWVTSHHRAGEPAVANLSLGGAVSPTLDAALRRSIADGVAWTVAAGNGNPAGVGIDACRVSPARVRAAITVGAIDRDDHQARFSNHGSCVDLYAPGVDIPSAWPATDTAHAVLSGTSMAAPLAAGVAALYLEAHPSAAPSEVEDALRAAAWPSASAGGGILSSAVG